MLVLLAPSEGKADPPADAPPVDLAALAFPALTPRRERLAATLAKLVAGREKRALAALGLGAGQAGELARDAALLQAPAAPAAEVYTGVLYQHLDLASLPAGARARAAQRLLVASALWGVVGIEDRIPAYRLSMGASLPRIPSLAAWWRPSLTKALPREGLVVDLRSGAYAAAWRPPGITRVEVKASALQDGRRVPISHMAKAVRGEVARTLVQLRAAPADPPGVAAAIEATGEKVELTAPAKPTGPWTIEILR